MKCLIVSLLTCFTINISFGQFGEWVWMKGDSIGNSVGNLGIQGISDSTNNPPGTYEPAEWQDQSGNFWFFGGITFGGGAHNNLWKFNPQLNEWSLMKGSEGIGGQSISYGTQGVPSVNNCPPSQCYGATTWVDLNDNLWLFGGGNVGDCNLLWKYSISTNEWTWMKGSMYTENTPGVYGVKGIASPNNTPGSRSETNASWTDASGNLWFYGGFHIEPNGATRTFADVWKYDISTNEWIWEAGDTLLNSLPQYGVMGIPSASNTPGSRWVYSKWKDEDGHFWIMGGNNGTFLNDLWKFDMTLHQWTWMGGTNNGDDLGYYGSKCIGSALTVPPSRYENRTCWTIDNCNFWMFGGYGRNPVGWFNDLWHFNTITKQWTWVSGDSLKSQNGHYGIKGASNINNTPSGRFGSVGWVGLDKSLWLFGGWGGVSGDEFYNDVWKFVPGNSCANLFCGKDLVQTNFPQPAVYIFPNPSNGNFTLETSDLEIDEDISIDIINAIGQKIFSASNFISQIDISDAAQGIYIVSVTTQDFTLQKKIFISR